MDGIGQLFSFIGSLGDELSNILEGEGPVRDSEWIDELDEVSSDEEGGPANRIRPLVINGPSGVGKGTLIAMLMKEYPSAFGFSVSHTTRAPRPGEQNGVAYHFTTTDAMLPMIENNEFLESANVHGNLYGTTFAAVQAVTDRGQICVLDIDVQGTKSVKAASLDPTPTFIFIKPPNMEELEKRLRGRGTETEDKIQKRLTNAKGELAYADETDGSNYDYILVNNELQECYTQLKTVIQGHLRAVQSAAAAKVEAEKEAMIARMEQKAQAAAAAAGPAVSSPSAAAPAELAPPTASPVRAAPATPSSMSPSKADLSILLEEKEAELAVATGKKDRKLSRSLLDEIDVIEAQLDVAE